MREWAHSGDIGYVMTQRVMQALYLASKYGQIDGAHHKMWVIDQMARALLGEGNYEAWVGAYCYGNDGPDTHSWDQGVAP